MPSYEYDCKKCGQIEVEHKMSAAKPSCPKCDGELNRIFSVSGIIYRGTGFYTTDSKSPRVVK